MEPIASRLAVLTPVPRIKSPVVVIGDRALNAAEAVVWPVPPEATARVPARVIVPDVVMGPPLVVRPVVPPLTSTLLTVPPPKAVVEALVTTP